MRRLAALLLAIGPLAGEDSQAATWLTPVIRPFRAQISLSGEHEPTVSEDPGSYARTTTRSGLRVQPWHSATNELTLNGTWVQSHLDSNRAFPDGTPLPERLHELRLGAVYRHVAADGRIAGLALGATTADENPFATGAGTTLSASAFLRLPLDRDAWVFSLTYTESSPVLGGIPVPGVLYSWQPQPGLGGLFGLPVTVLWWRPSARTAIDGSVSVFGTGRVGISQAPWADLVWLRATAAITYGAETFGWPEELAEDERVIFRAARASIGLEANAGPVGRVGVTAGWQFARAVILGESLYDRDTTRHLEPGPVVSLGGHLRF